MTSAEPANCVALSHVAATTATTTAAVTATAAFLWHRNRFGFRPRARTFDGGELRGGVGWRWGGTYTSKVLSVAVAAQCGAEEISVFILNIPLFFTRAKLFMTYF